MLRGVLIALASLPFAALAAAEVPLPPLRPPDLGREAHAPTPPSPPTTSSLPRAEPPEGGAACAARLANLGIKAEPMPSLSDGACGAESPLKLVELPNGLAVSPPATVTCAAAEALANWVLEGVSAEAERHLSAPPSKIRIGTSYECRSQNRRPGAKLSEHAFANAVDVMGFEFHKRRAIPIASRPDESPEAMFLGAVRARACEHFATVLGPGSDAAHADHLHLDMRERRRGAKLCQ